MPKLPDIGALGARPAPVNRQGIATQDTTAEGRGAAQLGQVIGQVGGEIADEYNRKNDEQAVFEARRKLNDWEREKVKAAVAKRGRDAFDLPKTLPAEFDKFSAEVAGGMANGRQQAAYEKLAEARRLQIVSWADDHELKQREVFNEGQYQADLKSFADRAVLYAGDPAKVATELALQNDRTISYLKGKGQSEEYIAAAVRDNSSRVHTSVIASMLADGNASGAKDYLTKNAAGMGAEDVQRVRESLKEGLAREKSQAFADQMADKPLAEALTEARKRFTGVEETAVVAELKTRAAEKEAIKATATKENTDSAWKVITNGGSKNQIPIGVWNGLGGEEQRQINDYVEAKWRRAKADAEKKEVDPTAYYGLRLMAAENPEQFANLDLMKSEPYVSKQQIGHLIELQAGINKGDLKAMESQATIKRTVGLVKQEILNAGIDLTPKEGTAKAKETAAFFGSLTQALDNATAAKGKALTDAEAKAVGMGMLRENIEQGSGMFGFFQTKKRGYQIPAEEAGKFVAMPYDKIPKAVRDEIEADIRKRSGPAGIYGNAAKEQQEVERVYQRAVQAGVIR